VPDSSLLRANPGARVETPLCRVAQEFAALTGWRRYGLGFLLGVLLAAALPPIDLTPLVFVAFPGLLWLDDGSAGAWPSARLFYVFALGFFAAGLYWIAAALFVDIGHFWWALPFAVFGLPAFLALFPAAALGLSAYLARRLSLAPAARICLFAVAWSLAEWVRGNVLTGFPWNLVGYAWAGGFPGALAMLQSAAWIGIYGLSFLTVLAASLPALLGGASLSPMPRARRAAPVVAAVLLVLLPATAGAIRLRLLPTRLGDTWLRLVQPSIPQGVKWDPAVAEANFRGLAELSDEPSSHKLAAVIWPEAAATFLLERDPVHRAAIAAVAPQGGYVITGALRANPPDPGTSPGPVSQIWNSIEAIDGAGAIRAVYDKAHLVPFGEYMPFRGLLPLGDFIPGAIDMTPGPGPRTLALPGLPPFSPTICYEAIFPGRATPRDATAARPAWMLNVTNDAWYGHTSGPYQHFAIARTRAIEEGMPLVRAANNGISGVIDPVGRVLARTRLDGIGYVDIALPEAAWPTPYSKTGEWIFLIMLLLGLVPVARWRGN
jgi:apolipoprotein N-acyltransferase